MVEACHRWETLGKIEFRRRGEMADTLGLEPSDRKVVGVQVPPAADIDGIKKLAPKIGPRYDP